MSGAPKPLRLNAFAMVTPSHVQHGQWRRPDASHERFDTLEHWIELATVLERGAFDALFLADVVGTYGPVGASLDTHLREGLQIPNLDPSILLAALISHTSSLGLALTSSVLQAHPFEFARRMSTLDQLSGGRVAWNVVTSYQENAARNFGLDRLGEHDTRYADAEEYLDVVYKLWEGSWDEGAVLRDKRRGFSDPDRVHRIQHVGARFSVEGPHLAAPSPQRTPFLFQAGSSPAGRRFAARHAEAQFVGGSTVEGIREIIAETRMLAVEAGRRADDILCFAPLTIVVGSTHAEALRREQELDAWASEAAFIEHANMGWRQDDGSSYPPETRLRDIDTNGNRSALESMIRSLPGEEPTMADLGRAAMRRHPRVVGTPDQIADHLERLRDAGVDGINIAHWTVPDTYVELVDHVLPVLRARGLARDGYAPGGLRERLTGSPRLPDRHPAARFRGAFVDA